MLNAGTSGIRPRCTPCLLYTSFDSFGMGKDAVDLMTATKKDVIYEGGGTMAPVPLVFKHELVQLKLTVCTGEKPVSYTHLDVYKRQVFG